MKLVAATVGAGAAIAGATVVAGVAGADTEPFVNEPAVTSTTEVTTIETPEPGPDAGISIEAPSTTATTTEIPAPN